MLRCWSAVDSRPSFKVCLEHIVALRASTEDSTLSPVNPGQFLVHGKSVNGFERENEYYVNRCNLYLVIFINNTED